MPAVLTQTYRDLLAAWTNGEAPTAPEPAEIAFGDGGLRTGPNDPQPPAPSRMALVRELYRKPILGKTRTGGKLEVLAYVTGEEAGNIRISECGLFDAQGRMLAYATFREKALAPGVRLDFRFELLEV